MEISKSSHSIVPETQPTKKELVKKVRDRNNKLRAANPMYPVPDLDSKIFDVEAVVYDPQKSESSQRYWLYKKIVAAYKNKGYSQVVARGLADRHTNDILAKAKAKTLNNSLAPEIELKVESDVIKPKKAEVEVNEPKKCGCKSKKCKKDASPKD